MPPFFREVGRQHARRRPRWRKSIPPSQSVKREPVSNPWSIACVSPSHWKSLPPLITARKKAVFAKEFRFFSKMTDRAGHVGDATLTEIMAWVREGRHEAVFVGLLV